MMLKQMSVLLVLLFGTTQAREKDIVQRLKKGGAEVGMDGGQVSVVVFRDEEVRSDLAGLCELRRLTVLSCKASAG